jgi:hypothetical protein
MSSQAIVAPDVSAARHHTILRFAAGTAGAFAVSEAMGWYPSFLAPLLAGVLFANLPGAPPFKAGVVLVLVQAVGAYGAYLLATLLHETPAILFGSITVILLVSFANLARGRGFLPILLLLISFATVPVVTMMTPQQGTAFPFALTRGMVIAIAAVWLGHFAWPKVSPPATPNSQSATDSHFALAITGVAIVLPLMLVYLMYGITDALPVLITTIVLVINFDPKRGAMQAMAMMIGNFIGGMIALLSFAILQIAPSLAVLALIAFLIGMLFAIRVERGGPGGAVALITFNQAMVMFSLSLAPGGSSPSLWTTRLFQFGIACTFAVGMMSLLFPRLQSLDESRA